MTKTWHQRLASILSAWIGLVERFNFLFILLILGGAVLCLNYTIHHIGMDTNTTDMLSPELDWRKLDKKHDAIFPQYTDNILVVVEAGTPDEASDAASLLYKRLKNESGLFKSVYYPAGLPFFKTSSLLYLDEDELQDLADNLAAIQPFLARLTEDQSLRGLFNMLSDAVQAKLDGNDIDLKSIPEQINDAFIAVENHRHFRLSWQNLMTGTDADNRNTINREFIILQPVLEYDNLFPGEKAMKQLRSIIADSHLAENNIRVRLTGGVALSYEEMSTVMKGMGISAVVAFAMVTVLLIIGLRSAWMVLATIITLLAGLIYTAWFAAITVVNLNLISVAFTILYIGLGVDFAIHFCLRYREVLFQGKNIHMALKDTAIHTGESLLLCAVTTAIGFYAFIPTDYDGVAELGLISGTGMFISLVITMTLLPAMLSLFPVLSRKEASNGFFRQAMDHIAGFPIRHAKKIRLVTLLLAIVSLVVVVNVRFDHNTLNLQPRKNESVQTYIDLLADSDTSPWTGILLAKDKNEAETLKRKLDKLPLVDKTVWVNDFIPKDQENKLFIIEQMDLLLGGLTTISELPPPTPQENMDTIRSFNRLLGSLIEQQAGPQFISLHKTIDDFLERSAGMDRDILKNVLQQLEKSLLATFPGRYDALIQSMNAEEVTMDTLPDEIRTRWYSDGYYRLEIYPVENLNNNTSMRNFVNEVRTVAPQLIGSPVIDIEAGDTVVRAFQQALLYALVTIIVLLLFLLDRKKDTIFLLIPLLLATLFTGAISVMLGIPLNFANVIALPLLMGIGVDSGIHILHRFRTAPPADGKLLATSSARAVVISALTTIFSIGNLAFSQHPGTASMGILLTIGISMTLICTLVVLPSLLATLNNNLDK